MGILITPEELAPALESDLPPAVLDVRWRLDRPDGFPDFLEAHIPGAVYVDLDAELAAHSGDPREGRHPLPTVEHLQESARRWGVRQGQSVVVYDDFKSLSAARAWWLLRYAGIEEVRILDGSLRGWIDAGHPVESGESGADHGSVTLGYGNLAVIDVSTAASFADTGTLLDARAGERYRGETEPIDPRAGHIPGAVSAPTTDNLDAAGRFLPPEVLRERFQALGISDDTIIAAYCGSGVTAAHEVAALAIAGYSAALYPGSWSQWSNLPDRPVAVGPNP